MLYPFFALAARSPTRQRSFRTAVAAHLFLLLCATWAACGIKPGQPFPLLGHLLLCAAIVEGALLVGWRLTQMPKSQALEFILVSPLRPHWLLVSEMLVGAAQLLLITLAGLPLLAYLVAVGLIQPCDLAPLLILPFTWGLLTGVWLTTYAYEPLRLRRAGELATMVLVLLYLVIGVLAGEHLGRWLQFLPTELGPALLSAFYGFHAYNPFGLLKSWLEDGPATALKPALWLEAATTTLLLLLVLRSACRLQGHFHERHYQPARNVSRDRRTRVGDRPLSWWAVKRVLEYSGRINLYLAGGFGLIYAAYTVAGPLWPGWLGKRVFELCDSVGGIAGVATGLVLLAAVPAAFQYGLWDSNVQDRCRRLELLLLTELQPVDYWHAARSAAWRRGRGYFAIALLLWIAAALAGQIAPGQVAGALAAGLLLWAFYFTLGFRAFSRGTQANNLGMTLTLGLPLAVYALHRNGLSQLGDLLPPGLVYRAAVAPDAWLLASGLTLLAVTLVLGQRVLLQCDRQLRSWYDLNQGRRVLT